jgi:selenocysteine lyase/cysteine desulfurase
MSVLDELRATEYAYLDANGHVYLDYTGAGLPSEHQLRAHAERITLGCFGNPHSENPTSAASTRLVEMARDKIRDWFNASPDEYAVIFTPNATAACRLVGEAYPFGPGRGLVLTADNHNSVNGLRRFARSKHARVRYIPLTVPDLRVTSENLHKVIQKPGRGLFAYPAQSNFSGVRHPLEWIESAQKRGYDVLLDAAAFVPSARLDLSAVKPDFVSVSWYKVFGYPTGVGCLVARKNALDRLRKHRPWFSGGTILGVSVQGGWHQLTNDESAFEDGTLNFLAIPDVVTGLDWVGRIGMDLIGEQVRELTSWLLNNLVALKHSNGEPMVRVYGPDDDRDRGGTIAFNFLDPGGAVVDERAVARDTSAAGISLRTGCFCNPGAGEWAFGITRHQVRGQLYRRRPYTIDDYLDLLKLPSGGAVRVSFGLASNHADAERFLDFAERTYRDRAPDLAGLEPRLHC